MLGALEFLIEHVAGNAAVSNVRAKDGGSFSEVSRVCAYLIIGLVVLPIQTFNYYVGIVLIIYVCAIGFTAVVCIGKFGKSGAITFESLCNCSAQ